MGRLCSSCIEGYAPGPGGVCTPCSGASFALNPSFLVFLGVCVVGVGGVAGVVVLLVVLRNKRKQHGSSNASARALNALETKCRRMIDSVQMKLKILVAFCQIAGSFRSTFSIPFPASYTAFMSSLRVGGF